MACPNCGSQRTIWIQTRVPVSKYHRNPTTAATWQICLDCWRKWNGATDDPHGILPAGVKRRQSKEVEMEKIYGPNDEPEQPDDGCGDGGVVVP